MVMKNKTTRYVLVLFIAVLVLAGCLSFKKKPAPLDFSGMNVSEENVSIIEYKGSAIGDPVPLWIQRSPAELESGGEYPDRYVFRFEIRDADLTALETQLGEYPFSQKASIAVHDRAWAKAGKISGISESFLDEAGRVLTAIEYMGARRCDDFWAYELLFDEEGEQTGERYRGWILVTVPQAQVQAALELAHETAGSHQPPANDRQTEAREELLARFRLGL